jgi:hypothetical protein
MLESGARLGKGRLGGLLNEIVKNGSRANGDDADRNAGDNERSHVNTPSFATSSRRRPEAAVIKPDIQAGSAKASASMPTKIRPSDPTRA